MLDTRHTEITRCLMRLPLFSDIGQPALLRLAQECGLHALERGQMVFHQGDPCEQFYVVAAGQVKLFGVSPTGQEKIVEIVAAGNSFAEALMFLGKPCMVSAQALSDTVLVSVSRASVMSELAHDNQFALRLLAGLSRRLHGLVHDVQAYALQNGVQRVIGYLLNQRTADEDADPAAAHRSEHFTVSLPISKGALASRLSLTPEYFSRVLRELVDARLINVDGRDIHVLDTRRLAAYTG
jgi:CRP/FNR family transcriptional regulator, dissimilatory nitrate respiration regulator